MVVSPFCCAETRRGRLYRRHFETSGFERYVHLGITARRGGAYRGCNSFAVQSNDRPLRSAQHYDRYSAAAEVLLIAYVLVGGKKYVETGPLRFGQQVAVGKPIPSPVSRLCDRVADEIGS